MIASFLVAFGPAVLAWWSEDAMGSDCLKVHCTEANPHTSLSYIEEANSVISDICFCNKGER